MDNYASAGIGATIVAVLGIIYRAVNHRKARSRCCGKTFDVSLDIDVTVPTPPVVAPPAPAVVQVAASEALVLRQPPAASEPSSANT